MIQPIKERRYKFRNHVIILQKHRIGVWVYWLAIIPSIMRIDWNTTRVYAYESAREAIIDHQLHEAITE